MGQRRDAAEPPPVRYYGFLTGHAWICWILVVVFVWFYFGGSEAVYAGGMATVFYLVGHVDGHRHGRHKGHLEGRVYARLERTFFEDRH